MSAIDDIIQEPGHDIDPIDFQLAKTIGDTLEKHYPGWAWQINVKSEANAGVINVISAVLNDWTPKMYGYVLHLGKLGSHKDIVHKAVVAGGELLERANMPRDRWSGQEPKTMDIGCVN